VVALKFDQASRRINILVCWGYFKEAAMVALLFVVAVLAAISLGLVLLYRWTCQFEAVDQDDTTPDAAGSDDAGGFAHLGIAAAAHSGSRRHS
jgi:hypothetical protein